MTRDPAAALRELADAFAAVWPEKAAELRRAADDVERLVAENGDAGDAVRVRVSTHMRLDKFDGPVGPEAEPVETIESVHEEVLT